jgi:DNA modification methylase
MNPATATAAGDVGEPMPRIVQADARSLPLASNSVDLVVTSPPYYGLRSYQDGGRPYEGQIGAESTPEAYLDALLEATRECVRVLKPTGSIWVNLGDRYSTGNSGHGGLAKLGKRYRGGGHSDAKAKRTSRRITSFPPKSLLGIPWRYAIRCLDELGLTLRAEVVWSKPNALPESVTDRVRRSHETWFHFTRSARYFSALDEIRDEFRESHSPASVAGASRLLGKLPGSVWEIPTQPLTAPPELGVDHYAAFPMEWPRRLILGWSPREVCTTCGQGRRPVVEAQRTLDDQPVIVGGWQRGGVQGHTSGVGNWRYATARRISDCACACPAPTAPTLPGVVLDPFGGTGTTALVAVMHGRRGISIDASADYCRLARWRASDPRQRAKAATPAAPRHRRRTVHTQHGTAARTERAA